ncbi:hypothetical protein Ocin01_17650, partial [Orchesella cincta]
EANGASDDLHDCWLSGSDQILACFGSRPNRLFQFREKLVIILSVLVDALETEEDVIQKIEEEGTLQTHISLSHSPRPPTTFGRSVKNTRNKMSLVATSQWTPSFVSLTSFPRPNPSSTLIAEVCLGRLALDT